MVVSYPSSAEGSALSFFTDTPRLIFWRRGSALPNIFPQTVVAVAISCLAYHLQQQGKNPLEGVKHAGVISFLLCFLAVFKVQTSFDQFWAALEYRDNVVHGSRYIIMSSVSMFQVPKETKQQLNDHDAIQKLEDIAEHGLRRVLRHIALHFFVVLEFFQRTGSNATTDKEAQDQLRDDIRSVATPEEMKRLYPDENPDARGSECTKNPAANSALVMFWVQMTVDRVQNAEACNASSWSIFNEQLAGLMQNVQAMNKIDKTQFPLPYAQIVKILMVVFIHMLPFLIVEDCGLFTLVVVGIVSLGFYGLDEVAEILESPFGNDPNDIDLRAECLGLMSDISMFYNERKHAKKDFDAVWDQDEGKWKLNLHEPEVHKWNDLEFETGEEAPGCFSCCAEGENYGIAKIKRKSERRQTSEGFKGTYAPLQPAALPSS